MSWPSSTDPFYLANTSEQNARRTYYGVNSIPAGFGNGVTIGGSASSWRSSGLSNIGSYTPITITLNGGEDYELLMTISQKDYPKIKANPNLTVIGYIKEKKAGCNLILRDESSVELKARGWGANEA